MPDVFASLGKVIGSSNSILPNHAARLDKIRKDFAEHQDKTKKAIPFFNTGLLLTPGPHALLAPTGKGKTNAIANLVYDTWAKTKTGTIAVMLNEELPSDFYTRIACFALGLPLLPFKTHTAPPDQWASLHSTVAKISERVVIIDDTTHSLSTYEDVVMVMRELLQTDEVILVCLDYLQNVTVSKDMPGLESFKISKQLGHDLVESGKTAMCPFVVVAQIHEGNTDYAQRLQNDRTFVNNVLTAIEMKVDKVAHVSDLVIQKDRFNSMSGTTLSFNHKEGRLSYVGNKARVNIEPTFDNDTTSLEGRMGVWKNVR